MLTVYIDFKSAPSYLAIKPTLAPAERVGISIDWRPFRTVQREVPKRGTEETVGERHRRVRAASQRALVIKYAAHQGIDLNFPDDPGRTDLALGVLAGIRGDRLAFIRAAFAAYWDGHESLDDTSVVDRLLYQSGAEFRGDLNSARDLLERVQNQAETEGIVGAPAYVIADQIFIGREHLLWIEDLLRKQMIRQD